MELNWEKRIIAFLAGQTISLFGSSLVQFAIVWYVTAKTSSGIVATISVLVGFLPQIIVSLFGGVLADRYNRKWLIIFADGGIAITTFILAMIMAFGNDSLVFIFIASAIRSLGAGIQSPAISALLPQLVPEDQLMRINGINGSIQSLVMLLSPAIAGALLTYGVFYHLLFIDVITAIIGIVILFFIPVKMHQRAGEHVETKMFTDLKNGIKYTYANNFVRKLLFYFVVISILIVPVAFLNVLLVVRAFGDDYLLLTLNEVAFFVGASIGGVILAKWGGFRNRLATVIFSIIVFGVTTILLGLFAYIQNFPAYLVSMALCGLGMPGYNSPVYVLLQEKVDENHLGRVFSVVQIVSSALMPIGMLVFGPLADIVDIEWMLLVSGVMLIGVGFCMYQNKRFMKHGLPSEKQQID